MIIAIAAAALAPSWEIVERTDPINDAIYATVALQGKGGKLALKCDAGSEGQLYVAIVPDRYFGGGRPRAVTVRFDQGLPMKMTWQADSKYAYTMREQDVGRFVDGLATSKSFAVRALDFKAAPRDVLFVTPSDQAAVSRIKEICRQR